MRFSRSLALVSATALVSFGLAGQRTTDLYFVRHGETQANATGHYNSRTLNSFSVKGQNQVRSLPFRLQNMGLTFAICSPSPRAMNTAVGVLRNEGLHAEIWPEFNECCTQSRKTWSVPAHRNSFRRVGRVRIPINLARWFVPVPGDDQMIADGNYQDGLRVTAEAVRLFKQRFSGSGKHILIVGHSGQGGRFLEMLLDLKPVGKIRPDNTAIYHLREQGGIWRLVSVSNYKG